MRKNPIEHGLRRDWADALKPFFQLVNGQQLLEEYITELEDWIMEADSLIKKQYASNLKLQKEVESLEQDNAYLNRIVGDPYD